MDIQLAGRCLLASPFMEDSNFSRSVVLILQHSEQESFGLVLNRPTDFTMSKVVSMVCELECVHSEPLYYGGPVDGPLIAIHDSPNVGGHPFSEMLYVTSDQDDLKKLFVTKSARVKLFDGFSGWGPGQLQSELDTGSWLVSDITVEEILSTSDLWDTMVKRIGHQILATGLDRAQSVADPSWN
ncbi:YqgE/AlgH family protein [Pirellula sp. SH-Sr6A]|uniref:YqgE/AlgH family protein n=1 Tax=Pirellula sp. SH-Sr6A TaxID=1632865 RepID=UPI0011BA95EA|nr:YqgE/AlgH family protein [Pirellula sp. SH-Sr6A]